MKSIFLFSFFILSFFLFSITLVLAADTVSDSFGYNNKILPKLSAIVSGGVSNVTANNTFFWQGYTPSTFLTTFQVVRESSSYANPVWITSLAWSKITGTPITIEGYGITNAYNTTYVYNKTEVNALIAAVNTTGDITAVLGDAFITNGSTSGSVNLIFNVTRLNESITSLASQYNSTDFLLAVIQSNNASWLKTFNSSYDLWAYNQTIPAITFTNTIIANTNDSWLSTFNSSYIRNNGDNGITGNYTITNGNLTIVNGSLFYPLPLTGQCDIIFQVTGRAMRFCRLNAAGTILTAEFTSNLSSTFSQIIMGVGSANSGDIFAGNGTATTDSYINSSVSNRIMQWNNFFPVLKPTNTPVTCNSATEGLMFQNATSHIPCICNSTTYNRLGGVTRC